MHVRLTVPATFVRWSKCAVRNISVEKILDIQAEILAVLDEILGLQGRSANMTADTPLLGAVPELDSMAVVGVIGAIEERFEIFFDDDEIDGQTFATVGSLVEAVRAKVA